MADSRFPLEPRVFPSSGWDSVDPSFAIEGARYSTYNHRYQVVGKLGYGSSSTVWLCPAATSITREMEIYNNSNSIKSGHAGQSCLRPLLETFQTQSPDRQSIHTCLVHPPLGISLHQLTRLLPDKVMTSCMARTTIRNILAALDFLHAEAGVIHTERLYLSPFEEAEFEAPIPQKTPEDRTIYLSRPLPISCGTPVLCDLGEARIGTDHQQGDIMPDIYRAPEVILDMSWDYKVGIWNIWDLFEHHNLFKARNAEGTLDDGCHLAEMQGVLGGPPAEFLARSERSKWRDAAPIPASNLSAREERLQGDGKDDFLRFLRRMLCWIPEERATAKELLFDPWLMQGLFK
ncbi:kinase-like domain-containing protein [Aspergillus aurantiobrunneus]